MPTRGSTPHRFRLARALFLAGLPLAFLAGAAPAPAESEGESCSRAVNAAARLECCSEGSGRCHGGCPHGSTICGLVCGHRFRLCREVVEAVGPRTAIPKTSAGTEGIAQQKAPRPGRAPSHTPTRETSPRSGPMDANLRAIEVPSPSRR